MKFLIPDTMIKTYLASIMLGGFLFIFPVFSGHAADQYVLDSLSFSSLLERGSDFNAMAFNNNGDLYFIGWEAGLERATADQLPDGSSQTLLPIQAYLPFFEEGATSVKDINGAGIAFDHQGRVISYFGGVADTPGGDQSKMGFVRCNPNGSDFTPIDLSVGEAIPALDNYSVGDAFGVYYNADGSTNYLSPTQMVLTTIKGVETLLFTIWAIPAILQAPAEGGAVTIFQRYPEDGGFPGALTLMERDSERSLVLTYNDGSIHKINLDTRAESVMVLNNEFQHVLAPPTLNTTRFIDIDYEPVSDTIYIAAATWWDDAVPETLIALSLPDGSLRKVVDVGQITEVLAPIRTPGGQDLGFSTVVTNPIAIAAGQPSLFLSDYWTGIQMVRMDITPPAIPIELFDLTGDGAINYNDLYEVLLCRNKPADACPGADVNGDGYVTVLDGRIIILSCDRPRCATQECFSFIRDTGSLDVNQSITQVSPESYIKYTAGPDHSTTVYFDLYINGSFITKVGPVPVGGTSDSIVLPLQVGERLIELRNVTCEAGVGSCTDGTVSSWGGTVCVTP